MKNKFIDYLFMIANLLFFLGIAISSILILRDVKRHLTSEPNNTIYVMNFLYYIPYIVFLIISFILLIIYTIFKKKYLDLITIHTKQKYIIFHYLSIAFSLLFIIVASIMFVIIPIINARFLKDGYFYILISISFILNMTAIGINSYSNIKIKIDLIRRRTKGIDDAYSSNENNNSNLNKKNNDKNSSEKLNDNLIKENNTKDSKDNSIN